MSTPTSFRAPRSSALFGFLLSAAGGFLVAGCASEGDTCTGLACSTTSPSGSAAPSSGSSGSTTSTANSSTSQTSTAPTSTGANGSQVGPSGSSGPSGGSGVGPSASTGVGPSGSVGPTSVAPTSTGQTSTPTSGASGSSSSEGTTSAGGDTSEDSAPVGEPNPSGLMEPGEGGVARPSGTAGNLTVLPWAGYSGAVSYTFDDADSTQVQHKAEFFEMGVPFTWYLTSKFGSYTDPMYKEALALGHEIGNHTSNHGGQGSQEVTTMQAYIQDEFQVVAYTMAAPNGSVGDYRDITRQLFLLDRGAGNDGVIKPDDNPDMTALNNYIPPQSAGTAQFNPKVDAAVSQGGWFTVCIHGFDNSSGYQPVSFSGFKEHIEYAKTKDIWIGTMENVAAYFIGRKLVKAAQPVEEGGNQVYTWTLPTPFPPGKYVRVTVDGGTLSQDGTPLPWNEHGFYEVALDVGELTLAP